MPKLKLNREGNYIHVGNYDLGNEVVGLLAEIGSPNGYFVFPKSTQTVERHSAVMRMNHIVVGLDRSTWRDTYEVLLHEALELSYCQMNCRYDLSPGYGDSHASYMFMASHEQFTEAIARAAMFLSPSMADLCKIYRHVRANPKKFK